MLFEDAFKQKLIPEKVSEHLVREGRWYPCAECKRRTPWSRLYHDCPGVPVCSDECLDVSFEREPPVASLKTDLSNTAVG